MVYLFMRWPGTHTDEVTGEPITERRAPYVSLADARAQADHDLNLCKASDDYTTAPVRVVSVDGNELWVAPIPDGR